MQNRAKILSTRCLTPEMVEKIDTDRINMFAMNFILTRELPINKEKFDNSPKNWILTSKKSIKILLNQFSLRYLQSRRYFVVGQKSLKLLLDNNLEVAEVADNALELGQKIVTQYKKEYFFFIGGEMRLDTLSSLLKDQEVRFTDVSVYQTVLSPNEIKDQMDGLMFFSPSAVQSYVIKNSIGSEKVFCIGQTTAKEAKKYSQNITVAKEQTFESVIESVNQIFK
ncbi:MAG: uroporphyrinogen-III synthase [Putridiphycobacter sp.]